MIEKPFQLTDKNNRVTGVAAFGVTMQPIWTFDCPQDLTLILRSGQPLSITLYDATTAEFLMPGAFTAMYWSDPSGLSNMAVFYPQNYELTREVADRRKKYLLRIPTQPDGTNFIKITQSMKLFIMAQNAVAMNAGSLLLSQFTLDCAKLG